MKAHQKMKELHKRIEEFAEKSGLTRLKYNGETIDNGMMFTYTDDHVMAKVIMQGEKAEAKTYLTDIYGLEPKLLNEITVTIHDTGHILYTVMRPFVLQQLFFSTGCAGSESLGKYEYFPL